MDRPDVDELRRRRDSLIAQIERDFAGVRCINGISIEDADLEFISTEESVRRKGRVIEPWREVDVINKDPGGSAMSFMDPVAFRYYLPAYMRTRLRTGYPLLGGTWGENAVDFLTDRLAADSDFMIAKYANLDEAQRHCVAMFLAFDVDAVGVENAREAVDGLRRYWGQYLSEAERRALVDRWPEVQL